MHMYTHDLSLLSAQVLFILTNKGVKQNQKCYVRRK